MITSNISSNAIFFTKSEQQALFTYPFTPSYTLLSHIYDRLTTDIGEAGAIVFTTNGNCYISVSAGRIKIGNNICYAVLPVRLLAGWQ